MDATEKRDVGYRPCPRQSARGRATVPDTNRLVAPRKTDERPGTGTPPAAPRPIQRSLTKSAGGAHGPVPGRWSVLLVSHKPCQVTGYWSV